MEKLNYDIIETTIFKNFIERKENIELTRVLKAIKEGTFKTKVELLRNSQDKYEKKKIKNSLYAFTPSMVLTGCFLYLFLIPQDRLFCKLNKNSL